MQKIVIAFACLVCVGVWAGKDCTDYTVTLSKWNNTKNQAVEVDRKMYLCCRKGRITTEGIGYPMVECRDYPNLCRADECCKVGSAHCVKQHCLMDWSCSPNTYPYKHLAKRCVSGANMAIYHRKTVQFCKAICNVDIKCKAFEFFRFHGGPDKTYKPGDCVLNSKSSSKGCNGTNYNLDLYVKELGDKGTGAPYDKNQSAIHPGVYRARNQDLSVRLSTVTTGPAKPVANQTFFSIGFDPSEASALTASPAHNQVKFSIYFMAAVLGAMMGGVVVIVLLWMTRSSSQEGYSELLA